MIDIKAIRAAAEAAPYEAPWRYEPAGQTVWCDNTYMVADIRGWGHLQYLPNGKALQDATGVHIATANPATVLALCDEVERLQHANGNPLAMLGVDQLRDENKELRQEVERLRKDAARYLWIRHGDNDEIVMKGDCRGVYLPRNERLDAVIDAAMETKCLNQ